MQIDTLCVLFTLLMMFLALMRCPHAWEFVDKTEIPAPVETAHKFLNGIHYYPSQLTKLCGRRVIIVIRCPKCGAAKVFRES